MDMILTGPSPPTAVAIGLADRVVPNGQARRAAGSWPPSWPALPQGCMRSDRLSARTSGVLGADGNGLRVRQPVGGSAESLGANVSPGARAGQGLTSGTRQVRHRGGPRRRCIATEFERRQFGAVSPTRSPTPRHAELIRAKRLAGCRGLFSVVIRRAPVLILSLGRSSGWRRFFGHLRFPGVRPPGRGRFGILPIRNDQLQLVQGHR